MDEHELAWAAGFFDGDGWAALVRDRRRPRRVRPLARINQAGAGRVPHVLMRFRSIVGVGAVRSPDNGDPYYWEIWTHKDILHVASLIAPWLCAEKRGQLVDVLRGSRLPARRGDHMLPWCGGFFDAEGSTSLSDHRSHAGYKFIEASVTQSGRIAVPEELLRFRSAVGAGRVYGPYDQEGALQPVYRWRAYTADEARLSLHLLMPWIGHVKREQAAGAFAVIDAQPELKRGRIEWGSHKTHCIHGHEYATARLRPYRSRGVGIQRRDSKQCLTCTREQARAKRDGMKKIGGRRAADLDDLGDSATC